MDSLSIVQDTKDFYSQVGEEFSATRRSYWEGWYKLLPFINGGSVCDLACGNGRFYGFLQESIKVPFTYTGYDTNRLFLSQARKNYPDASFIDKDILLNLNEVSTYDLVVAFGITHHIPDSDFRRSWFEHLSRCITDKGKIILTFWNFDLDPRFKSARKVSDTDFYLRFSSAEKERYFHLYTKEERDLLLKPFNILSSFESDGRANQLNTYYVLSLK